MTTIINGSSPSITFSDGSAQTSATRPFLNRIINGAMAIDQRNAGASVTATGSPFSVDRWQTIVSQASKFTIQQNAGAVTPPVGFTNYVGVTSSSAYSVLTGDYFILNQTVEGFNIADLGWGTANAKTITISFWVRSSLTGTFGLALSNQDWNYSYPASYTISVANTWEYKTVTIAGPTAGTWNTNNNGGVRVQFGLGVGSTYNGTAGSWAAAQYLGTTGATSVVGTNGATFYITGVQLEVGSTATSFDYRPYGTEFDLCRRYYEQWDYNNGTGINNYMGAGVGMGYASNDVRTTLQYYPKRTSATLSFSGTFRFGNGGYNLNISSFLFDQAGSNTVLIYNNSTSGFTQGQAYQITAQAASKITISAEL